MEELSEVHLLPEELEEYSKFSRLMKLLKKMRLRRQAELEEEIAMKKLEQTVAPQTVAPSTSGLAAAPVAPQPEPLNQVAMPKPINAKLEPLNMENKDMSVRVAAAQPNNPFERMLMRKFASLADDGKPSLEEAAAIGLSGLAGTAAGHRLAPMGSRWMAQEALGPMIGKDGDDLLKIMREAGGGYAQKGRALEALRDAAREHGLRDPGGMLLRTEGRILNRAKNLEQELASKLTKAKGMPFKVLGGLGAALGAAALLKNRGGGGIGSYLGSTPADASVGMYPGQMPVDMGGQY